MRLPWNKSKEVQLDLLDAQPRSASPHQPVAVAPGADASSPVAELNSTAAALPSGNDGRPLLVAVSLLYEDAHNPRTEFPDENATIARQLGMNLTAVAHHLSLLDLPPVLNDALKSGRCKSPRTLHELSKLHADRPDQVHALLAGEADITRASLSAIRSAADGPVPNEPAVSPPDKLIAQASAACDRLERALSRIKPTDARPSAASD